MKVIIAGSRHMQDTWWNKFLIMDAVRRSGYKVSEVVCGLAKGADTLGKEYSEAIGILCKDFPADWGRYGKFAGSLRNEQMGNYADAAIIFIWDGSKGSFNMMQTMRRLEKPFYPVVNGVIS